MKQVRHLRPRPVPYLACLVVVFPLVVLWSLATPVMAVVDQPNQIYAGAAAVRGEFNQPFVNTPFGEQQSVEVPGRLVALLHAADCLIQSNAATPSQCAKPPPGSNALTAVPTQFMRYPPLFAWASGWPTLLFSGLTAYWAVVLVAATINSALLALGLWALLAYARRRLMVFAWFLCLTPEVLYLAASANNSGLEISAAIAAWSCVLALASHERPPGRLVAGATLSAVVFMLARPASPLWVVMMVLTAALVAGGRRLVGYARQRRLQVAAACVTVSGLLAVAWRQVVGSPVLLHVVSPPAHSTLSQAATGAFATERGNLQGLVGVFLNTQVPLATLLLWIAALAVLAVGGLAFATARWAAAASALAAFAVAAPIAGNIIGYAHLGVWWQPRYGLPVIVGLPLVLAGAVPDHVAAAPEARRVLALALAAIAFGESICFVWLLHRYAAGIDGPWRPSTYSWQPPGGFIPVALLFIVVTATLAFCVWKWTGPRRPGTVAAAEAVARRRPVEVEPGTSATSAL